MTRDGNLVTGQAWPDRPEWLAEFLDLLGTSVDHGQVAAADRVASAFGLPTESADAPTDARLT